MNIKYDEVTPGMRGVIYCRHSTDKQTVDAQLSSARQFFEDNACICVDEYLDEGVSAVEKGLEERPEITRLLYDAHLDKFDFVIITTVDRLARDLNEHIKIRNILRKKSIKVIVTGEKSLYDTDNNISDYFRYSQTMMEAKKIKDNTIRGMKKLFNNKEWTGGQAPYGYFYNPETKSVKSIPHELAYVKKIFEYYSNYEGFESIAKLLPEGSYRDGFDWTDQAVRAVVTNPFYAGIKVRGRKRENANNSFSDRETWKTYEMIDVEKAVTIQKWETCWEIFESRSKGEVAPNRFKTSFWLNGLLFCSECSNALSPKDQKTTSKKGKEYGKKVYRCKHCGYSHSLDKAHRIVDWLISDMQKREIDELIAACISSNKADKLQTENEIEKLQKYANTEREKIDAIDLRINLLFANQVDTDSNLKVKRLKSRKESIENELVMLQRQVQEKKAYQLRISNVKSDPELIRAKIRKIKSIDKTSKMFRALLLDFIIRIEVNRRFEVQITARHARLKMAFDLRD